MGACWRLGACCQQCPSCQNHLLGVTLVWLQVQLPLVSWERWPISAAPWPTTLPPPTAPGPYTDPPVVAVVLHTVRPAQVACAVPRASTLLETIPRWLDRGHPARSVQPTALSSAPWSPFSSLPTQQCRKGLLGLPSCWPSALLVFGCFHLHLQVPGER